MQTYNKKALIMFAFSTLFLFYPVALDWKIFQTIYFGENVTTILDSKLKVKKVKWARYSKKKFYIGKTQSGAKVLMSPNESVTLGDTLVCKMGNFNFCLLTKHKEQTYGLFDYSKEALLFYFSVIWFLLVCTTIPYRRSVY